MYHSSGRNFHCADDCSCRNVAEVESLQHKFYELQHKQEKLERALATARPLREEFRTPTKESRHREVPTMQLETPSFDLEFDTDNDEDFPEQPGNGGVGLKSRLTGNVLEVTPPKTTTFSYQPPFHT